MTDFDDKIAFLKNKVQEIVPSPMIFNTNINGFSAALKTAPQFNQHCFYKPMVILVLQGKKQAVVGNDKFVYSEKQFIVTSVDIPALGSVLQASPEKPFMTLILELDKDIIYQLLNEQKYLFHDNVYRCMGVADVDDALLDAFYRLMLLLDNPEKQKFMANMIIKEIHYLLLTSSLGDIIQAVNTKGSRNYQIANAILWLKQNYKQPLNMEILAKQFNMSVPSFYRNFNKVTSLSPLQYQKKLRLYEAKRLILEENFYVANAAYEVGYESASQFNREYKRMFGESPKASIKNIQS